MRSEPGEGEVAPVTVRRIEVVRRLPDMLAPLSFDQLIDRVVGVCGDRLDLLVVEEDGLLRGVFRTSNKATLAVSGTGMSGMEAVLGSLLEPGDPFVVCSAGFFGNRIAELAARMGVAVTKVEKEWGQVFSADEVETAVAAAKRLNQIVECNLQVLANRISDAFLLTQAG